MPGNRLWGIANFISNAAGDESDIFPGGGLGADAGRDDVSDVDCAHPPYRRTQFQTSARSVRYDFVVGYAVIWMAAGSILIAAMLMLTLFSPQSSLPAVGVGIIAFAWQCSPIKQRCLNRNHNHSELAAFDIAADFHVLRFGVMHGIWCVGSCWALMLFPLLLSQGHFAAMAVVTFIMIGERLERTEIAELAPAFSGKLLRIVVAQTRIRLQSPVAQLYAILFRRA